jgi:hypothetical protein
MEEDGVVVVNNQEQYRNAYVDRFSTVTIKTLILTGWLKTAVVDQSARWHQKIEHNDKENAQWVSNIEDPDSRIRISQIAFDSDLKLKPIRVVHCLLILAHEKYGKWQLSCLGLVPIGGSDEEFSRVGLVFLRKADWYGPLEKNRRKDDWDALKDGFLRTIRMV